MIFLNMKLIFRWCSIFFSNDLECSWDLNKRINRTKIEERKYEEHGTKELRHTHINR